MSIYVYMHICMYRYMYICMFVLTFSILSFETVRLQPSSHELMYSPLQSLHPFSWDCVYQFELVVYFEMVLYLIPFDAFYLIMVRADTK